MGDIQGPANDINLLRAMANASSVVAAKLTVNYTLDERMRELSIEKKRRLTLARLKLVYDWTENVARNSVAANLNLRTTFGQFCKVRLSVTK